MTNHQEGYTLELICGVLLLVSLVVTFGVMWAVH